MFNFRHPTEDKWDIFFSVHIKYSTKEVDRRNSRKPTKERTVKELQRRDHDKEAINQQRAREWDGGRLQGKAAHDGLRHRRRAPATVPGHTRLWTTRRRFPKPFRGGENNSPKATTHCPPGVGK